MAKLKIYYLRLLFLISFFCSCTEDGTFENKRKIDILLKKGISYDYIRQGSELQMIYFDSVIKMNPKLSDVWSEKSSWSIKEGNYVEYFEFMNKAVALNPDIHIGWRGVVRLYYLRDYGGAIQDLNTLKERYPNTKGLAARGEPVLFLLGKAYWQKGEYNTALKYLNEYIDEEIETNGEDWVTVDAFLYKGICLYETEQFSDALDTFKTGITYSSKFPEILYYMGKTLTALKNNNEACTYFSLAKDYAEEGYIKNDSYREVFGQLYVEDIEEELLKNCNR